MMEWFDFFVLVAAEKLVSFKDNDFGFHNLSSLDCETNKDGGIKKPLLGVFFGFLKGYSGILKSSSFLPFSISLTSQFGCLPCPE